MRLPLAYRIASMRPVTPHPSTIPVPFDPDRLRERLRQEAQWIARVPHFNFSNVAEFYAAHDRQTWDLDTDIPNCAPPFSSFWVEWNEPKRWNMGPGRTEQGERNGQHGFFVLAYEVTDTNRADVDYWVAALSRLIGYEGPGVADDGTRERIAAGLGDARWVLCCSRWLTSNAPDIQGAPVWLGLLTVLFVAADGHCGHWFGTGPTARFISETADRNSVWSPVHVLTLGLSFCHCKNVRRVEAEVDAGERFHRREKVPRIRFYTLEINPMRDVLRREGESERVGLVRALHICRGHFATYTPEHPLFGKYVGTFWRPDHVRGSREAGEVNKNYSVGSP